jgi:hypothetical protein
LAGLMRRLSGWLNRKYRMRAGRLYVLFILTVTAETVLLKLIAYWFTPWAAGAVVIGMGWLGSKVLPPHLWDSLFDYVERSINRVQQGKKGQPKITVTPLLILLGPLTLVMALLMVVLAAAAIMVLGVLVLYFGILTLGFLLKAYCAFWPLTVPLTIWWLARRRGGRRS